MSKSQTIGFKLLLAGFVLILSGVALIVASSLLGGDSVSTGVIVFVGPVPIIIGTGVHSVLAIFLAAVFTILCLIVFFLMRRMK